MASSRPQQDSADFGLSGDMEDGEMLLSNDQTKFIHSFRERVRQCGAREKLQLCAEVRTRLLGRFTEMEATIAFAESVMLEECPDYENFKKKTKRAGNAEIEEEEWNRFIGVAAGGSNVIEGCLPPLRAVSRRWGREKIQHYRWFSRGKKFCRALGMVANKMRWLEFVTKANQLLLRRTKSYGRRRVRDSIDPLDLVELENVASWVGECPYVKANDFARVRLHYQELSSGDLPVDRGFDRYGLLVHRQHAVTNEATEAMLGIEPLSTDTAANTATQPPVGINNAIGMPPADAMVETSSVDTVTKTSPMDTVIVVPPLDPGIEAPTIDGATQSMPADSVNNLTEMPSMTEMLLLVIESPSVDTATSIQSADAATESPSIDAAVRSSSSSEPSTNSEIATDISSVSTNREVGTAGAVRDSCSSLKRTRNSRNLDPKDTDAAGDIGDSCSAKMTRTARNPNPKVVDTVGNDKNRCAPTKTRTTRNLGPKEADAADDVGENCLFTNRTQNLDPKEADPAGDDEDSYPPTQRAHTTQNLDPKEADTAGDAGDSCPSTETTRSPRNPDPKESDAAGDEDSWPFTEDTCPPTHRTHTTQNLDLKEADTAGDVGDSCPPTETTHTTEDPDPSHQQVKRKRGRPPLRKRGRPPLRRAAESLSQGCRSCHSTVPLDFLKNLDNICFQDPSTKSQALLLEPNSSHIRNLCRQHLERLYEAVLGSFLKAELESKFGIEHNSRKRRASSSNVIDDPKKPRLESSPAVGSLANSTHDSRPKLALDFDISYQKLALSELGLKIRQGPLNCHGNVTNELIYKILQKCQPPSIDGSDNVEAHFWTGDEAAAGVELGSVHVPIFTEHQQRFKWGKGRPIAQLFRRMENLDREVDVQIPSLSSKKNSFCTQSLRDVQERFLSDKPTKDPWNLLDLSSPLPASILPSFLDGENCQLLSRMRDVILMGDRGEREVAMADDWNEWRNVLEWVLLSEGGHNTAPHTDSHGFSTWITVQEGHFGFGWLSCPTAEERQGWMSDPGGYTGGNWRYVIIPPGRTVFFTSGTIHFVFRIQGEQTLALGGHVLQWTGIKRWLLVIKDQIERPEITNERMDKSIGRYIYLALKLLESKIINGRMGDICGQYELGEIFSIVKEIKRKFPYLTLPAYVIQEIKK